MVTGTYNNIDIERLHELNKKISANNATQQEKNELVRILYENDSLTPHLYTNYINGKRTESILETCLISSNIILFAKVLEKRFSLLFSDSGRIA